MTPLPVVTPRQLIRAFEHSGWYVHHVRGSHHVLKNPTAPALRVTVAYHNKAVKRGTLRSILRQADMTVEELHRLL